MRSRAPFSAQLRVFHQNITCSMHTFPSRIDSFWICVRTQWLWLWLETERCRSAIVHNYTSGAAPNVEVIVRILSGNIPMRNLHYCRESYSREHSRLDSHVVPAATIAWKIGCHTNVSTAKDYSYSAPTV